MSKKTLSIILGVIAVIIIGTMVYLAVGKKSEPEQNIPITGTNTPNQPPNPDSVNWLTYANSQYRFELKFPDAWKNYKAVETSDLIFSNVKYIEYALPTKDSKYYSMAGKGQITVLTVGIYPSAEWQKAQSGKYGPKPTLLGQNSKSYFGYYTQKINTTDSEFMKKDLQISEVIKTFKLTK